MNQAAQNTPRNTGSGILILLLAGIFAAMAITLTARLTEERINDNRTAYELSMLAEVLPADSYNNEPHTDVIWLSDTQLPGSKTPLPAFRARLDGTLVATALTTVAEDGYVGPIRLLIGINSDAAIIRVQTLEHRETPGLGDKLETRKSAWIRQFDGATPARNSKDPRWLLRQDGGNLDAISGATVTSRAVIRAVRKTQLYYLENSQKITAPASAPAAAE